MSFLTFYQLSAIVIVFIDNEANASLYDQLEAFYMCVNKPEFWSWPVKSVHPSSRKRMWRLTVVFTRVDGVLWLNVTMDGKYLVYDGYMSHNADDDEWKANGVTECSFCKKIPSDMSRIVDLCEFSCFPSRVVLNINMGKKFKTNLRIEAAECCELISLLLANNIGFGRLQKKVKSVVITKFLNDKCKKRAKVRVNSKLYYAGPQMYHQIKAKTIGLCRCTNGRKHRKNSSI